jgi:hypothetical protein
MTSKGRRTEQEETLKMKEEEHKEGWLKIEWKSAI